MNLSLSSRPLCGSLTIPSSKSAAHRALILAALAKEETRVLFDGLSEDISATVRALSSLGASFDPIAGGLCVTPIRQAPDKAVLDCAESGSTLRFLMPIAAALGVHARFVCHGRLAERPLSDLAQTLTENGITFHASHEISGNLLPGEYTLAGNVSSQYITGLLFALSLLDGESSITLTTPLESASYVTLTLEMLKGAGAQIRRKPHGWKIRGVGRLSPASPYEVEGDYSNAAFWLCAGISVGGLKRDSAQGDSAILPILCRMGAKIPQAQNGAFHPRFEKLLARDIDAVDIPDLVPPLAVLCAAANGESRIYGASRLRLKESDRIESVCALLRALSVEVEEHADGMTVHGVGHISGGTVDSYGDHRIAMAAALASHFADRPITVCGAECVAKSYPRFWDDFRLLGGHAVLLP